MFSVFNESDVNHSLQCLKNDNFDKNLAMATILIESNDKLVSLFIELANRTGAKVKKLSKQEQLEFQTGERLMAEKTRTRVPKSEVMEILKQKQL